MHIMVLLYGMMQAKNIIHLGEGRGGQRKIHMKRHLMKLHNSEH